MLAARWISSDDENKPLFTRKNLKDLLPETSAFLKDLFDKLVNSNFDKNLSWLLDDITSLLARTSASRRSSRTRSATRRSTSTRTSSTPTTRRCARTRASTTRPTRWSRTSCGPRTRRCRRLRPPARPRRHDDVGRLRQGEEADRARGRRPEGALRPGARPGARHGHLPPARHRGHPRDDAGRVQEAGARRRGRAEGVGQLRPQGPLAAHQRLRADDGAVHREPPAPRTRAAGDRLHGTGCVCFISNHGFISNPTFRGFRKRLLETFSTIDVLDLDGNSRRRDLASAELDENVFNIQQGVAIATLVLRPNGAGESAAVRSAHLRGSREKKFSILANDAEELQPLSAPAAPNYMFSIEVGELDDWQSFTPLPILMGRYGDPAPGFVTTHDEFAISWSAEEALHKVSSLLGTKSEADARRLFQLCTTDQWSYADAVTALSHDKSWKKAATRVLYRPFDWRYTIWNEHVNVHRRERAQAHLLRGDNLALVTVRQVTKGDFAHALVSDAPTELKLASHDRNSQAFPLWLYDDRGHRVPNFSPDAAAKLGVSLGTDGDAIELFHVIYAVLHSPQYRTRYSTHLRAEFPSVPPLQNAALRRGLARVGADLVATHLLRVDYPQASWTSDGGVPPPWKAASGRVGGTGDTVVGAGFPKHSGTKLMLNAARWVDGVSNEVWNFGIGGYPVLRKWLKSRAGRKLSPAEMELLSAVIGALTHTIVLMQQVDEVVGRFGGWPSAFCATEDDDE
jgi:hypothetical protein